MRSHLSGFIATVIVGVLVGLAVASALHHAVATRR